MHHVRKLSSMANLNFTKTDLTHKEKIYSGYLFKQSSAFNKKFQKRYFVLYEGKVLVYYASDKIVIGTDHKGEIDLTKVLAIRESQVKVNTPNVYQNVFEVKTKDRSYILSAPDIKSMNAWMDYIRSSVFGTKIHQGWLTKQGDFVKSWKRRYFVLTDTKLLRYFEDEEQTKIKGIINVQQILSITKGDPVEPYWNYMIHLQTPGRLWFLNADSEAKREEWLKMMDEGRKTMNYDASASLFVEIDREQDDSAPKNIMFSQINERIKYIFGLYEKWCKGNERFQDDIKQANADDNLKVEDIKLERLESVSTGFKAEGSDKSKGIWEILNNDLKDYSNIELLNDFNYLIYNYGSHSQRNKFAEFYRFILGKGIEKSDVAPAESLILMRNWRDRAYYGQNNVERVMLYNDSADTKEINTQILLDRFYAYIMYSYDTLVLDSVEWTRIRDYDETDKYVTANIMLKNKKIWMEKAKEKHHINDRGRKFCTNVYTEDMMDGAGAGTGNGIGNVHVRFEVDEERNIEYFEFGGQPLVYWDDDKESEWFIGAQFDSFKEEITSNKLCRVSMEQWNDCMESASNISESKKASEYTSYDGLGDDINTERMVDKYGIYEYTPIKLNHICSIVLYCNYYELQQTLMDTFAPNITENESISDWKLRHSQYAMWCRFLMECCCVFGGMMVNTDIFYHCINTDEIDFAKSLHISYSFPTSMTGNIFVAQSYFEFDANKSGMLLSVTKESNAMSFYMDCGWCSEFPSEQEVLVLSIYPNQSRINSMIHIQFDALRNETVFHNYLHHMSAMHNLDRMLHAQNASHINKQIKNALNDILKYRLGDIDDQDMEQKQKEVHITLSTTSTVKKPQFEINITAPDADAGADAGADEKTDDACDKKESDEKQEDETPKTVRPKGKLNFKRVKDSPIPSRESGTIKDLDLVFKLKAKRKRKVADHVKTMFDQYCESVQTVRIDICNITSTGGYKVWKDMFMNVTDTWFNITLLIRLFPHLNTIEMDYTGAADRFTKQSVKELIECLKSEWVKGRELSILIFKANEYKNEECVECFSLQNALKKYLWKKSKTGNDFCWISRLNEDGDVPCIEILRPNNDIGRNKDLSSILKEKQVNIVMDILRKELAKNTRMSSKWYLNLLFSASKDGFDADEFHKKCDGVRHTVSIIQSTKDFIFGAYTSKPWGRTGKWVMDEYAFLIQIQCGEKGDNASVCAPKIINIKPGHEQYGMYLQSHGGPGFGKGDIKILNKANKTARNTCCSNSFAFSTKPNELVGGKGSYFKVADYEVFQAAFY